MKTEKEHTKNEAPQQPTRKRFGKRHVTRFSAVAAVCIALVVGYIVGARSDEFLANTPVGQGLDLSSVEATYERLKENFDGQLDTEALVQGANKGLVEAAGDPYTVYFDAEEAKAFSSDLEGTFSGVGAELGKRDDKLTIITTLDDSPAKKAGLKANDIIAAVNEEETGGWSVEEAVSKIRGKKGTTVKLTIVRGDQEVKDYTVTRDDITVKSVEWEVTDDNIGIMRISRFGETDTVSLARQAAQEFKDKGVKGVVLDLRGNGGGYVQASVDVASLWLDGDTVVSERREGEVIEELKAARNPVLKGVPTTVLIDGGSASASEILAGALKDNGAAKLIGTKTYGKGSVQRIIDLAGGAQLKVTIAKWFTPNGQNIDQEGIAPDIEVKYDQKTANDKQDNQLKRALDEVKKL